LLTIDGLKLPKVALDSTEINFTQLSSSLGGATCGDGTTNKPSSTES